MCRVSTICIYLTHRRRERETQREREKITDTERFGEKGLSGIAQDRRATIPSGASIGTEAAGPRATGQESITHDGI